MSDDEMDSNILIWAEEALAKLLEVDVFEDALRHGVTEAEIQANGVMLHVLIPTVSRVIFGTLMSLAEELEAILGADNPLTGVVVGKVRGEAQRTKDRAISKGVWG